MNSSSGSVVEIGHVGIDRQHQRLFSMLNILDEAFYEGKGHQAISDTLATLRHYIEEHFSDEEQLMEEVGYPYIAQHKNLHEQLSNQVALLTEDVSEGRPVLSIELIHLLRKWLMEHINQADADIAKYLRK